MQVDTEELNRQAREKKARMDQENLQSKDADARLLEWSRQVEKLQDQVQAARQTASQRLADALHQQAQDKRHRDAITKEQLRNNMTEEYHTQFGTSHR